jgi:hypothetical protein
VNSFLPLVCLAVGNDVVEGEIIEGCDWSAEEWKVE